VNLTGSQVQSVNVLVFVREPSYFGFIGREIRFPCCDQMLDSQVIKGEFFSETEEVRNANMACQQCWQYP